MAGLTPKATHQTRQSGTYGCYRSIFHKTKTGRQLKDEGSKIYSHLNSSAQVAIRHFGCGRRLVKIQKRVSYALKIYKIDTKIMGLDL